MIICHIFVNVIFLPGIAHNYLSAIAARIIHNMIATMTTVEVAWWKEEKIEVILIVLESLWRWRNIYLVIGCWIKVGNVSITEIERQNYSIWLTLCSISGYISHISSDKWNTILRLLLLSMILVSILKWWKNICLDCIFLPPDTRFGHGDLTQQTLSVEFSLHQPLGQKSK